MSVEQAREYYGKAIQDFKSKGQMDPYMQKLQFEPPKSIEKTRDPVKSVIAK